MKRMLRWMAVVMALGGVAWWLAAGANRGWTKTNVPVEALDEVTGIKGISYEKRFVPGVDFMGGVLLGAGLLAGASLLFRKKPSTPQPSPS